MCLEHDETTNKVVAFVVACLNIGSIALIAVNWGWLSVIQADCVVVITLAIIGFCANVTIFKNPKANLFRMIYVVFAILQIVGGMMYVLGNERKMTGVFYLYGEFETTRRWVFKMFVAGIFAVLGVSIYTVVPAKEIKKEFKKKYTHAEKIATSLV